MRTRAGGLPAALVGLALLAAGAGGTVLALRGGDASRAPVSLTVREIWQDADAYRGKLVRSAGLVRVISPGTADEHYVLEEAGQYRVGLRGIERDRLRRLAGRQVTAEGHLRFAGDFGFFLDLIEVDPR